MWVIIRTLREICGLYPLCFLHGDVHHVSGDCHTVPSFHPFGTPLMRMVKIQADGFDWRLVLFGDRIAVKAPSLYLPWASITCSCVTCPSWRLARDFTRRAVPRSPFHTFCSLALATFFFLIAPSFTLSLPPCHGSQSPLGSKVVEIEEPLINLVVDVPASDERRQSHLWMKALIRLCHYLNGFILELTLLNG